MGGCRGQTWSTNGPGIAHTPQTGSQNRNTTETGNNRTSIQGSAQVHANTRGCLRHPLPRGRDVFRVVIRVASAPLLCRTHASHTALPEQHQVVIPAPPALPNLQSARHAGRAWNQAQRVRHPAWLYYRSPRSSGAHRIYSRGNPGDRIRRHRPRRLHRDWCNRHPCSITRNIPTQLVAVKRVISL
jgi:hypothetical protein